MGYHMSYASLWIRTRVSVDSATLEMLDSLAQRWGVSKAEVMRRAIRKMQEEVEAEDKHPTPLQAMEWLQGSGGLTVREGEDFKTDVLTERQAKRYWWE